MKVTAVQASDVDAWKERAAWHFDSFCKDGTFEPADLWSDVAAKARQLWVLEDDGVKAVILTRVSTDRHQTCEVTHAAGEQRQAWQHLFPALEHWARDIGCKRIMAIARPGWERILPLKKTHVILEGWL